MIEVKIIEDSLNIRNGVRLTTFLLKYPRIIHSEFLRHRMISSSVSSTRAIPVERALKNIDCNYFTPNFTKNKKGMASNELLETSEMNDAISIWSNMFNAIYDGVEELKKLGVHKQHASRPLEPFSFISQLATATDWENFFALRIDENAQPEIQELANAMLKEYKNNSPREVDPFHNIYDVNPYYFWHIPFRSAEISNSAFDDGLELKRSVARCARLSYLTFDGESSDEKDLELFVKLKDSGHWSPFEHQAHCSLQDSYQGNFKSWKQFRKTFDSENKSFDFSK